MSNPVVIRRRVQRNFTHLPNDVLHNPILSWKALGLLVYILSLPDDFRLRLTHLARQKPTGRDGTRSGLKELEKAGYVRIRKERQSGRFAQVFWDITDSPHENPLPVDSPYAENPLTVIPDTASPASKTTTLQRTDVQQELIKRKTTTGNGHVAESSVGATDVSQLQWPSTLGSEIKLPALKLLASCPKDHQQLILYEVAGRVESGAVRSPVGLLRALIESAKKGAFVPSAALEYRKKIEGTQSTRAEQATSNAASFEPQPVDRETGLAHLDRIRSQFGKNAVRARDKRSPP